MNDFNDSLKVIKKAVTINATAFKINLLKNYCLIKRFEVVPFVLETSIK